MTFPGKLPGLKAATVVVALLGVFWISLEGELRWSLLMAVLVLAISVGYLAERFLGARNFSLIQGLAISAVIGLAAGLLFAPLALLFMSIKTGIHGHGPEFTRNEIQWLFDRFLLWAFAGIASALGLAFLYLGLSKRDQ